MKQEQIPSISELRLRLAKMVTLMDKRDLVKMCAFARKLVRGKAKQNDRGN